MSGVTQHGFLVLAHISGYTSFAAGTELEHSHEILTELLELLVGGLTPVLTLAKLEGDAVFAFAPGARVTRGEGLLELNVSGIKEMAGSAVNLETVVFESLPGGRTRLHTHISLSLPLPAALRKPVVRLMFSAVARYKTPDQYETLARLLAAGLEAGE